MILLTGGSGRLGRELQKHMECIAPSRAEFDILKPTLPAGIGMIVHAAAYTDVAKAETDLIGCYETNVRGTKNVASLGVPVIYISTEYVFDGHTGYYVEDEPANPLNAYAISKLQGEWYVRHHAPKWLIIRTLFKERPYRHARACTDMYTSGDYVDVIAPMVAQAVRLFADDRVSGILHIGTGRKSLFDLAKQTRDVEPITRADVAGVRLPKDTSLDTGKWASITA